MEQTDPTVVERLEFKTGRYFDVIDQDKDGNVLNCPEYGSPACVIGCMMKYVGISMEYEEDFNNENWLQIPDRTMIKLLYTFDITMSQLGKIQRASDFCEWNKLNKMLDDLNISPYIKQYAPVVRTIYLEGNE